jgi:hypothetical protein
MKAIAVLHASGDWQQPAAGEALAAGLAAGLADPAPLVERECLAGPAVVASDARWLASGRSLLVVRPGPEPLPRWLGQLVYARQGRVRHDGVLRLPMVLGLLFHVDWKVEAEDRDGWRARSADLRRELLDELALGTLLAQNLLPFGARFSAVLATDHPIEAVTSLQDRVARSGFQMLFESNQVPSIGSPLEPWRSLGWEGRS